MRQKYNATSVGAKRSEGVEKKLRVGAVSYMNTKPLVWGLENREDIIDLFFEVPSKLGKMFEDGLLDVALLPAIRYFGNSQYRIIKDISIAAKGRVDSVNLYIRKNIDNIKEVALDTSSLTSRVLTAIILKKSYGVSPRFTDWHNGTDIKSTRSDAVLLIGDDAMRIEDDDYKVLDLAEEWYKLTNLPFVFAFWVTRSDTKLEGFDKILLETKLNGIRAIDQIAPIESKRLNFSVEVCKKYLSKSINYDLGNDEIKGLNKFYEFALELGLLNNNDENIDKENYIKFYN